MTRVTVHLDHESTPEATYRAVAGSDQASGRTAGEAVDALAAWLPLDEGGTLIIVRDLRPDHFFTAEQRRRLEELMGLWRAARDAGVELPAIERNELQSLVDAEVEATARRAEEVGSKPAARPRSTSKARRA
jgi:hypothetical protein